MIFLNAAFAKLFYIDTAKLYILSGIESDV